MSGLDHHRQPYDEGTLCKLKLFEEYAKAWIPTFVMSKCSDIYIIYMTSSPELEEIQMVFTEVLSGFCGKSKAKQATFFRQRPEFIWF